MLLIVLEADGQVGGEFFDLAASTARQGKLVQLGECTLEGLLQGPATGTFFIVEADNGLLDLLKQGFQTGFPVVITQTSAQFGKLAVEKGIMTITGKTDTEQTTAQQADTGGKKFFALFVLVKCVQKLALPALSFLGILHPLNHEHETLTGCRSDRML